MPDNDTVRRDYAQILRVIKEFEDKNQFSLLRRKVNYAHDKVSLIVGEVLAARYSQTYTTQYSSLSARLEGHESDVGTGVRNAVNPHGMAVEDITDPSGRILTYAEERNLTTGGVADDLHKHRHPNLLDLNTSEYWHLTLTQAIGATGTITDHRLLSNLNTSGYWHLTQAEATGLISGYNADSLHSHLHNSLAGLNLADYRHLTNAELTGLTTGAETALHKHKGGTVNFTESYSNKNYFDIPNCSNVEAVGGKLIIATESSISDTTTTASQFANRTQGQIINFSGAVLLSKVSFYLNRSAVLTDDVMRIGVFACNVGGTATTSTTPIGYKDFTGADLPTSNAWKEFDVVDANIQISSAGWYAICIYNVTADRDCTANYKSGVGKGAFHASSTPEETLITASTWGCRYIVTYISSGGYTSGVYQSIEVFHSTPVAKVALVAAEENLTAGSFSYQVSNDGGSVWKSVANGGTAVFDNRDLDNLKVKVNVSANTTADSPQLDSYIVTTSNLIDQGYMVLFLPGAVDPTGGNSGYYIGSSSRGLRFKQDGVLDRLQASCLQVPNVEDCVLVLENITTSGSPSSASLTIPTGEVVAEITGVGMNFSVDDEFAVKVQSGGGAEDINLLLEFFG